MDGMPAFNPFPAMVQTTKSAFQIPSTEALAVGSPAVRTHEPKSVTLVEESTALKYLGGRAMVILPPTGTAVAGVKPKDMESVSTEPGT